MDFFKQFDLLHVSQDCVSVSLGFCWWCIRRISSSNGCILFVQSIRISRDLHHSLTRLAMTSPQPELLATTCFFSKKWLQGLNFVDHSHVQWILWWDPFYVPPNCAVLTGKHTLLATLLSELPTSCMWNCLPRGVWFWHLLFRLQKCK